MTVIEGGGGGEIGDNDCYRREEGRNRVTMTVIEGEEK